MTTTSTVRAFRVKGTTDDVTECELCGRAELRGTVVLEMLDADGNATGAVSYYGSSCGAQTAGWTQAEMRAKTAAAVKTNAAADQAEREATRRTESDVMDANFRRYCVEVLGLRGISQPSDLAPVRKSLPVPMFRVYSVAQDWAASL